MTRKFFKVSVLSYFYISVVLDGLQRLSGLFVLELLKSKNETHQNAVIPFIFSWAVANIVASFSDIQTVTKYSDFAVIIGVLLSATGAALCILDTNIITTVVFWGFIFGSGYGLATPHLIRRLKSTDSGKLSFLLQGTSSLGVTIMPFVLYLLIPQYGLQGSYLIFSGIILHYFPLALAASYNIEITIPNIKWRVRKKSQQYSVSKQITSTALSTESFINSLEPDLIRKINPCDKYNHGQNINVPILSSNEVSPVGRKRSDTRGNDLQGLETDRRRIFSRNKTFPQIFHVAETNENSCKLFEGNFNSNGINLTEQKEIKNSSSFNYKTPHSIKTLEKNVLNSAKDKFNYDKDILPKISVSKIDDVICEDEEFRAPHLKSSTVNMITPCLKNIALEIPDKDNDNLPSDENHDFGNKILIRSEHKEMQFLSAQKFHSVQPLVKETQELSLHSHANPQVYKIPLDIKVHVEEYIITRSEEYWNESFDGNCTELTSNENHLNSVLLDVHEKVTSDSKSFIMCSDLYTPKLSNVYSISELSDKLDKKFSGESSPKTDEQKCSNNAKLKTIKILKHINSIVSPVCLCIVLIAVIFETNLVTLLTMFVSFGKDVNCNYLWILVAFGTGGLIGKFCCCKISRTIPEKSHAIGVVLFLLTGLCTTGILYSPSLDWLAGFYCILGALEGGIAHIIPKFILEYTHIDVHSMISSVKCLLSGAAILCFSYVIGLFPEELGDYEFLLQTLSCSSVLCAFLAYFLPHLRATSEKEKATFKGTL